MKKRELKNIIKECVREVMFEDGMLSGIISEVVQGIGTPSLQATNTPSGNPANSQKLSETKQKVLKAVAANSYEDVKKRFKNPALFENTNPIPDSPSQGALGGISPHDPGVDINNLPGFGAWGRIAAGKE